MNKTDYIQQYKGYEVIKSFEYWEYYYVKLNGKLVFKGNYIHAKRYCEENEIK